MKLFFAYVFWGFVHDRFLDLEKFTYFMMQQIHKVVSYSYKRTRVDEADQEMLKAEIRKITNKYSKF